VYDFAPIFPLRERTVPTLTATEIAAIAHLARLALSEAEVPAYGDSMTRIMAPVGELDRAVTTGVEPMSHPLPGQSARLRADVAVAAEPRELLQQNAPRAEAGLYLVPRVIE
jgi:aspartyl-tRNA(Asn)/glutamyl-tRNA(Gln) amidotransferase subunit C